MNKQLTAIVLSRYFVQISFILPIIVIPLGFEPKTHSLEGCCSIQLSYRTILVIVKLK